MPSNAAPVQHLPASPSITSLGNHSPQPVALCLAHTSCGACSWQAHATLASSKAGFWDGACRAYAWSRSSGAVLRSSAAAACPKAPALTTPSCPTPHSSSMGPLGSVPCQASAWRPTQSRLCAGEASWRQRARFAYEGCCLVKAGWSRAHGVALAVPRKFRKMRCPLPAELCGDA